MSSQVHQGHAGWHPDPAGRFDSRYWDGHKWTRAVMRDGEVDTDPENDPLAGVAHSVVAPQPTPTTPMPAGAQQPVVPTAIVAAPASLPTDRFTSLAPGEAQSRLVQMLTISGVSLTDTAPGRLSAMVSVASEPNWIVVVALCFFWLVPGLVYWYVKSRPAPHPLVLRFVPAELGTQITIQGDSQALEHLAPMLAQLPW